jgi:hypothetical protein
VVIDVYGWQFLQYLFIAAASKNGRLPPLAGKISRQGAMPAKAGTNAFFASFATLREYISVESVRPMDLPHADR